ncbi:MAG: DUF1573 domain-containing protein [Pirellulaceae bacterium]|nr:DUF1573 domain-containing protein [Pirellulaceae bacterium]
MFRAWISAFVLLGLLSPGANAQSWARKMFKVTEHDFGTVAKGSKAEFDFELQNIFEEDVHISHVRSSCGCTEPQITKQSLKTWDKSAIRAVFNTRSFIGSRSATLTVVIDQPYYAEVQLSVRGYIRADVLFTPGGVSFGEIEQGGTTEQWVSVSYAGRSDWSIVDVRSANANLEVELTDPERRFGRVSYKMLVRLKGDAPAGYLQDQLTIVTNDSYNSSLELPVEGRVVSPLTVSPASLFLGVLKPGETVEKKLFVKGTKPFRILSIECDGDCFKFSTTDKVTATHLIPITYTAGEAPGKITQKIAIKTDLGSGAVTTCVASATITDAAAGDPPATDGEGS